MARILALGKQSFQEIRKNNCFYVDKTKFIVDWWTGQDDVTLITRPRRFGKTLMLDTVRSFFAPEFVDSSKIFEGLVVDTEIDVKKFKIQFLLFSYHSQMLKKRHVKARFPLLKVF